MSLDTFVQVDWSGDVEGLCQGDGSVLSSARLVDNNQLHCVLLTLESVTQGEDESREHTNTHSSVNTLLHWVAFNKGRGRNHTY